MRTVPHAAFADAVSAGLAAAGDPARRAWWERYLKGVIAFHGVPMADIRRIVGRIQDDLALAPAALFEAADLLLSRPVAEEKLAGILVIQGYVLPGGHFDSAVHLPRIAARFDAGDIADWNTCDWLGVRVLGATVEREGRQAADRLAAWAGAPGLWRRRAAAVGFVPLAARGDAGFPGLVDLVLDVCASNVSDSERFAQTGVGWVLRELSDAAPERVFRFVTAHRNEMSVEAVRMAASRLTDEQRTELGISGQRRRR